jgi:hypothetical protein
VSRGRPVWGRAGLGVKRVAQVGIARVFNLSHVAPGFCKRCSVRLVHYPALERQNAGESGGRCDGEAGR